jgi:hypothetical protein
MTRWGLTIVVIVTCSSDSSTVDADGDLTELLDSVLDQFLHVLFISHIGFEESDLIGNQLLSCLLIEIGYNDSDSESDECLNAGQSDS